MTPNHLPLCFPSPLNSLFLNVDEGLVGKGALLFTAFGLVTLEVVEAVEAESALEDEPPPPPCCSTWPWARWGLVWACVLVWEEGVSCAVASEGCPRRADLLVRRDGLLGAGRSAMVDIWLRLESAVSGVGRR